MMRILILFLLIANSLFSQVKDLKELKRCATAETFEKVLITNPLLRDLIFTEAYDKTTSQLQAVVTIPVVVHVLYNSAAQNISTAQIQSQISVLNEDYRKQNTDVSKVPSYWTNIAADAEIQFCLAQRDPSGNFTTGITRTSTGKTQFNADTDDAKFTSTGGNDAWPSNKYLNIWVVPALESGGDPNVLGYAQLPGGNSGTDGVVIIYKAFGRSGTATSPYHKGRTATHEIGHWFGLVHTWGDANCGNDLVNDTPIQQTSTFGCPTQGSIRISCNNGPNGDMWMNFMDYTDDACMYMFTQGQKTRMNFYLNNFRSSIISSNGCSPISIEEIEEVHLKIYPNPSTGNFWLDYSATKPLHFEIFDILGKRILSKTISTSPYWLETDDFAPGLYIIKGTLKEKEFFKRIQKL